MSFTEELEILLKICSHYLVEIVILASLGSCIVGGLISDTYSGCAKVIDATTRNEAAPQDDKRTSIKLGGTFEHRPTKDAGLDTEEDE